MDHDDIHALRDSVRLLEERVAALERRPIQQTTPVPTAATPDAQEPEVAGPRAPDSASAPRADRAETFWALDGVRARRPDHPSSVDGLVMLVGSVALPDGTPVEWQQGAGSAGLLDVEWADRAAAFAALGHPVRLELLRHVLSGTHTTADLAAVESLGTTGQLHHHLRQLLTTGWLRQAGRGTYEVPAARVVPLLVCLTAVER